MWVCHFKLFNLVPQCRKRFIFLWLSKMVENSFGSYFSDFSLETTSINKDLIDSHRLLMSIHSKFFSQILELIMHK